MKIGTLVHLLRPDGRCSPAWVTAGDDAIGYTVVSLQGDYAQGNAMDMLGELLHRGLSMFLDDSGAIPKEGTASIHLPEKCPWER